MSLPKGKICAVVLKFKDKGTEDTIESHQGIIKNKGHVWWGWWSKDYENLPINELQKIQEQIKKNPNSILFFCFIQKKKNFIVPCVMK